MIAVFPATGAQGRGRGEIVNNAGKPHCGDLGVMIQPAADTVSGGIRDRQWLGARRTAIGLPRAGGLHSAAVISPANTAEEPHRWFPQVTDLRLTYSNVRSILGWCPPTPPHRPEAERTRGRYRCCAPSLRCWRREGCGQERP